MNRIIKSKTGTWIALLLIVAILVATFALRTVWWAFFDIFFFFMMAFCHLLALNLMKMSPSACRKLDLIAGIFGIMGILAFIVEFILLF